MKKNLVLLSLLALMIGAIACNKTKEQTEEVVQEIMADTLQTSLDWAGSYSGVIPCADCQGIFVRIDLTSDNRYTMEQVYQGATEGQNKENTSGSFIWNAEGTVITLQQADAEAFPHQLKVEPEQLIALSKEGKEMTGELADNYKLSKINEDLVEKYWKLTELKGQPVAYKDGKSKEAFITFNIEGNRVHGNFSCNTFNGTYTLKPDKKISFSQMIATRMMCMDMTLEKNFNEILPLIDHYAIDGNTLVLNNSEAAPLARFESVLLR